MQIVLGRVWKQIQRLNMKRKIGSQNKDIDEAFAYKIFRNQSRCLTASKVQKEIILNHHMGGDQNMFTSFQIWNSF